MLDRDAPLTLNLRHRLLWADDVFSAQSSAIADVLDRPTGGGPARVALFVDTGLLHARRGLRGELAGWLNRNAAIAESREPVIEVPGGERAKNDPAVLERVLRQIHAAGICRQSYVIAIGGGALLDVVGYAAALAHRGVRLIRIPTTTLGQCDSGVGVKNGVNAFGKKNYLGTFAVPWAVINDVTLLRSLDATHWISGFSEAVKVALVKDAAAFAEIEQNAEAIARRDLSAARPVLARSAALHFEHIVQGGDPFELTRARPLDFGHWSAHKLEALTGFTLPHGHAVAIGVALDTQYSVRCGLLDEASAARVHACLIRLGFPLWHEHMSSGALLDGLEEFREHLGGPLTVTLLRGIGDGVDVHEIDPDLLRSALDDLATLRDAAAATR